MSIDIKNRVDRDDKPLTRFDVERLLQEVGSTDKLDLSDRNLMRIDLSNFDLTRANLRGANLRRANLYRANLMGIYLHGADLYKANLREANLHEADLGVTILLLTDLGMADLQDANLHESLLDGANLINANLNRANLYGAFIIGADLSVANLQEAILTETQLNKANLSNANLSEADLTGADLSEANLSMANLHRANLSRASLLNTDLSSANLSLAKLDRAWISIYQKVLLQNKGAIDLDKVMVFFPNIEVPDRSDNIQRPNSISTIRMRIVEEPLTAKNFTTIMSSLSELYTKCWLIAKSRYTDLIEYTETHNPRFDEEAHLIIDKLTHNSPAEIKLTQGIATDTKPVQDSPLKVNVNVDASPKGVMEAIGTAIDAIAQAPLRYKEKKLETDAQELAIKLRELESQSDLTDKEQARQIGTQKAELEKQITLLELESRQLEVEKQRVGIQEQRLDLEKKRVDYALETAGKMINILNPGADAGTKAILAQTLLSSLLQLGNGKGLELALPLPKIDNEETTIKEV